ncbi:MAG TPA: methyltransferase domain-containing protein [Gemmatimonadales bacterium]|nr:methyltransferase domain-containing protein [Gemmatimonadales bacterium]
MTELSISPIGVELLDDPAADPVTVAESLRNIARANRWFGGAAAVRHGLARTLRDTTPGQTLSLLDLGTGAGDLPRVAERWGCRRGIQIKPVGLELSRAAAALAQHSGLPTVVGCAGTPPIRDKSVDIVLVSQVAHHLSPRSVVHLLRTCDRLARRAVILADLRRHPVAAAGFRLGGRLLGFDAVTLNDGVTSIRRGFSRAGLLALMAQAGITGRVDATPGFRLVATWLPEDA